MNTLPQLIKASKFLSAERVLRATLAKSPNDAYALIQLANVLWNRKRYEEALTYADKAIAESSDYNPLLCYTRGRIFWSLERYEDSVLEWDKILREKENDIAKYGCGHRWGMSVVNDARYYKADCLYHLYKDTEALPLIVEHLQHRTRGLESDFSKKEAVLFYKKLKYSPAQKAEDNSADGYASMVQRRRISKRIAMLEQEHAPHKLIRYLKIVCNHYPKEYYLKVILSEYYMDAKDLPACLHYAREAYELASEDPLVIFNYAVSLKSNGRTDDARTLFENLIALGEDYIAFSEHGEGTRWARNLLRKAQQHLLEIS